MKLKLLLISFTILLLIFLFPHSSHALEIYDITDYGATPDYDINLAVYEAWRRASQSMNPSKVVIPKGTWFLSQMLLEENKAPIELNVQGTIISRPDPDSVIDRDFDWIVIADVDGFTLSGGGVFDGRGLQTVIKKDCKIDENQDCIERIINLSFEGIRNSVVQDITTKDSKHFHMECRSCNNVTFQRISVSSPADSLNTDGLHIAQSSHIRVFDSIIQTGDDCVSIGDDTNDIHIKNITCGPGHGISVGGLGISDKEKDVNGIYIKNCTFIGTQNGVRIKTWPSTDVSIRVSDLHFEDLIMTNVTYPVIIDQEYCPHHLCKRDRPSMIEISDVTIKNVKGTSYTRSAVTLICSSMKPCKNIFVSDIALSPIYRKKPKSERKDVKTMRPGRGMF